MAKDPEHESTSNEEEPAGAAEREVPIGVPVNAEEFARLKEQAAKPTPGNQGACPDENAAEGREEEEGNG